MSYVAGIDVGFSGAICILSPKGVIEELADMPVLTVGSKRELDEVGVRQILTRFEPIHAFIEKAQVMPGQGISSSGRYMASYGMLRGICVGLHVPYTLVTPQSWKKAVMEGQPKGKDASRFRANQLYPDACLSKKRDHGKAEALLIGHFGLDKMRGTK